MWMSNSSLLPPRSKGWRIKYVSQKDKVAITNGGAAGLGKITSLRFARAGAVVVASDINDAIDLAKEIGGVYVKTNVSKEDQIRDLMERTIFEFHKLDIVVNNAGVFTDKEKLY